MPLSIRVNGTAHTVDVPPDTPLLYVLRNDLALDGPKFGCGLGQCGACTVQLGDDAIRSCTTPVSAVGDKPVRTVEGLGTIDAPSIIQAAFIQEQAGQCAYCMSGMIMSAAVFLERRRRDENRHAADEVKAMVEAKEKHQKAPKRTPLPPITDEDIRTALTGNLCRCGSHLRIVRAVRRAIEMQATAEKNARKARSNERGFGGPP